MGISRQARAVLYLVAALIVLAVSVYFNGLMRAPSGPESAYFDSNTYLFALSAVMAGAGAYSFFSYTRRHREYLYDSVFLMVCGFMLVIFTVVNAMEFGGLEAPFDQRGYTAANLNITALSLMPLLFFARGFALSLTRTDKNRKLKMAALILCAVAAALFIIAAAFGGLFRFVYFDGGSFESQW